MKSAARLCDVLGIQYRVVPPDEVYYQGWGQKCHQPEVIKCTWILTTKDSESRPIDIKFDLTDSDAPLIIGIDFLQYADTCNREEPRVIRFRRPGDAEPSTMFTYIAADQNGNERLRLEVAPHAGSLYRSLLASNHTEDWSALAIKIHKFSHAHPDDIREILRDGGKLDAASSHACDEVFESCLVCAGTGRPAQHKKVSLTHVNSKFNEEIQADFCVVYIRGAKFEVLNMSDTGTRYGERTISSTRSADAIKTIFEENWVYQHGAPKRFSADPEFCRPVFQRFMAEHGVTVLPRPSRSSHKNGRIERNNGVFKLIVERIALSDTKASPRTVIARASFLANCIRGSKKLSAFQLVRGYRPAISGIPACMVSQEMIDAYISHESTRALNRMMTARMPTELTPDVLPAGTPILVFYNSSKQNERAGWIRATVVGTTEHTVICRRKEKGAPMNVAYGDVRILPDNALAKELAQVDADDEEREEEEERDNGPIGTLLTAAVEKPEKDIGVDLDDRRPVPVGDLTTDEGAVLLDIKALIGAEQVTRGRLEGIPAWIIEKSLCIEHEDNWKEAYISVPENSVPRSENIIASHVVYKVKTDEKGGLKLKARICPHGNRDRLKDDVRKDSSTAQFDVIRLALSMAAGMNAVLGHVDIKGAYLQSGPIKRTIYVRPPRELGVERGTLWKLTKLPYGITEAGRQWAMVFEQWLTEAAGLERVSGADQLFVKRNEDGAIFMLMAKVTDDLLMVGSAGNLADFVKMLGTRFPISKSVIDDTIRFNGCLIRREDSGDITMSMAEYSESIGYLDMTRERRKQADEKVTKEEYAGFRSLAGEIMWLGGGVSPQSSFVASYLQQRTSDLRVKHLTEANKLLKQLKLLPSALKYKKGRMQDKVNVFTFADASYNIAAGLEYGQTGIIVGLTVPTPAGDAFHLIEWSSQKQRRISHSSYGAEILACADGDDRGFHVKSCVSELHRDKAVEHTLHVDSRGLFDTITTLHNGREYRLRQTVQRIRDGFESGETDAIRWVQSRANIADALTKWAPEANKTLSTIISSGRLVLPQHESKEHRADEWK